MILTREQNAVRLLQKYCETEGIDRQPKFSRPSKTNAEPDRILVRSYFPGRFKGSVGLRVELTNDFRIDIMS